MTGLIRPLITHNKGGRRARPSAAYMHDHEILKKQFSKKAFVKPLLGNLEHLGHGLKGGSFAFALVTLLSAGTLTLPLEQAQAAYTVFDPQNLAEMLTEKVSTIEQWGVDNMKQIEQLQELVKGNNLAQVNSSLNNLSSWDELKQVYEETMAQIYAVQSLWREYEAMADFLSSLNSTEAWLYCLQQNSTCNFDQYFELIDKTIVTFSQNSVLNAQKMQQHLQSKAQNLKQLQLEGQKAQGHADILDNLAKINTETASSLIALNSQSAQLVELISREQANEAVTRQATLARQQAFAEKGGYNGERHVELRLPEHIN